MLVDVQRLVNSYFLILAHFLILDSGKSSLKLVRWFAIFSYKESKPNEMSDTISIKSTMNLKYSSCISIKGINFKIKNPCLACILAFKRKKIVYRWTKNGHFSMCPFRGCGFTYGKGALSLKQKGPLKGVHGNWRSQKGCFSGWWPKIGGRERNTYRAI